MKYEKISAGLMASLMLLTTFGSAVLAVGTLGDYPSFLGEDTNLNALVIVGSGAKAEDVAGAVDIALRLAELSYKSVSTSTTSGATGTEKSDISIGLSATSTLATGANAFSSTTLTNTHFSGLWTGTIKFNNNDYKAHEAVLVPNVYMRHDLGTDKINGTQKMVIGTSAAIKYQYVFDQTISGLGSIADPNYTKYVKISMMGKEFSIVGAGASSLKMLVGSTGTVTQTQGVTYGDYTAYSDLGSNAAWARVIIKDSAGTVKDTLIINVNDSKDSSATSLTVKVTAVRALQDGTVAGVDLVVGPTGSVEQEFDSSADTGTASKEKFPGESVWYITTTMTGSSAGTIGVGSTINVEYRPSDTQYFNAGDTFFLPNKYAELGFVGFNTDKFATITIQPVGPVTAYNSTDTSVVQSPLYGWEIMSDPANSVGNGYTASPNWWTSMYLLLNASYADAGSNLIYPVMIGYKAANGKVIINDDLSKPWNGTANSVTNAELSYGQLNGTTSGSFQAKFKLRYAGVGDITFGLNITVQASTTGVQYANPFLSAVLICASGCNANIVAANTNSTTLNLQNKSAWTSSFDTTPFNVRLGPNAASADETDLFVTTEGSNQTSGAGKKTQDVLDDLGIFVVNSAGNGASDKVVLKIPSKALGADVYFGKKGGAATTGGVVKEILPVTSAVARLDTEALASAADKTKNWVSVGGGCANQASAEALGVTFQTFPDCATGIAEGTGLIKVVADYPATGLYTVVVAGFSAANTRTASTVLQNYDTLLKGQTAKAVVVTSADLAGITPVTESTT